MARQSYNSLLARSFLLGLALFSGWGLVSCDLGRDKAAANFDDRISDAELQQQQQQQQQQQPRHDRETLYFGFDLRGSPQEDARQYLPFLQYLEKATGYAFELRFTSKNSDIAEALGTGRIQIAAVGAVGYIMCNARHGSISLVRGVNNRGKAGYQSMVVVSPASPIKGIEALRGKRFAFGSINSTQGHLIPRIVLKNHGIGLDDLAAYEYTGSHQNCAKAVISGRFDACGMQDTMAKEMAAKGLLRILYASRYYPSSGIVASKDVAPEKIAKIKQALLNYDPQGKHKPGLYNWHKTEMPNGFVESKDSDYAELREWAIKSGMLSPTKPANSGKTGR